MGEYTEKDGTRSFSPDNTPNRLYLLENGTMSLGDVMRNAERHFGSDIDLEALTIEAEHINTRCIGFDAYDGMDWDNYLVITKED